MDTATLWKLFSPYPRKQPALTTDFSKLHASLGMYRAVTPVATKKIAAWAGKYWLSDTFDTQYQAKSVFLMTSEVYQWAKTMGVVNGKGSNSWVVAGSH